MSQQSKRPLNVIQDAINKNVSVRLKNDVEYKGKMENVDSFMNLILNDAEEYNSGSPRANYGTVVIRGNNVLFIKIEENIENIQSF
mgnify:CR=1 FL=1